MRIRHRDGEDSNLIFRRKVVLHSGVRLGRVGCSQQGICRGDRAHEDAAGSAVDVDEAFTADGGADEGFGGALYGEIKVGEFIIILFADVPPLSMIEGAFLKYFGIPVALTWFMSQKTFDGKNPFLSITIFCYFIFPLQQHSDHCSPQRLSLIHISLCYIFPYEFTNSDKGKKII